MTSDADRPPTHVLASPGDRRALCGVKALPVVWCRYVAMHVQGRGMKVCPDCATVLDQKESQ